MKKTTLFLFIAFIGIQCINAQELSICNSEPVTSSFTVINVSGGIPPYIWYNNIPCGDIDNESECNISGTCIWLFGQCLPTEGSGDNWIFFANGTTANYSISSGESKVVDSVGNELIFNPPSVTQCSALGIDSNNIFNIVTVFPNPNEGIVNINFGDLNNINLKVINPIGVIVYQKENINETNHQFELEDASGIYFVELSSELGAKTYKLIIH